MDEFSEAILYNIHRFTVLYAFSLSSHEQDYCPYERNLGQLASTMCTCNEETPSGALPRQ